jgi:DNA modification methylase
MFPLDFPLEQMRLYPEARRVLDPFCGRGTTLYAARLAERESAGVDINPSRLQSPRQSWFELPPVRSYT